MLKTLIVLKKTSNLIYSCAFFYLIAIGVSWLLNMMFGYKAFISYFFLLMTTLVLCIGGYSIKRKNEAQMIFFGKEVYLSITSKRVLISASSMMIIAFMTWQTQLFDTLLKWHLIKILILLFLLSLFYRKKFKKFVVTEILKEELNVDFEFVENDIEKTSRLIAEHVQQQLKEKYIKSVMVRPLRQEVNNRKELVNYVNGFITKGKSNQILFELNVELENKEEK